MKAQYFRVYKNNTILKQEFENFIENLKKLPNYDECDYSISKRRATIDTEQYCLRFVVENRETFMGRTVDYVYFDESEVFDGKVVNEAITRVLRTKIWRIIDEHHNRQSKQSRSH